MNNSINSGILQSLDIITANAEAVIDEVAELKALINERQRKEATTPNKCSVFSFYEGAEKFNKRKKTTEKCK